MGEAVRLPDRIFFTGVPGSRWSGIAQLIETVPGFNITDRNPQREYAHSQYSGHKGAYYGNGMEFPADPCLVNLDRAWRQLGGCRLFKSHEWVDQVPHIKKVFKSDWVIMVYRPDTSSFAWWNKAGGFDIKYPNYELFQTPERMFSFISETNQKILKMAGRFNATWSYFNRDWIQREFDHDVGKISGDYSDVLITIIKPDMQCEQN